MAEAARIENWDKASFVAFHAINANPFLKRPIDVDNPFRSKKTTAKKVRLEDLDF